MRKPAGGSAIIQLNSARGNYSSVAAGASTITILPHHHQKHTHFTPSGINRHANVDNEAHMPLNTPVHKIHTQNEHMHQNKPSQSHLLFFFPPSSQILPSIPGKIRASTITQRHRSAHDLATKRAGQAGAAPEEVILFLFVRQRKREGRYERRVLGG